MTCDPPGPRRRAGRVLLQTPDSGRDDGCAAEDVPDIWPPVGAEARVPARLRCRCTADIPTLSRIDNDFI